MACGICGLGSSTIVLLLFLETADGRRHDRKQSPLPHYAHAPLLQTHRSCLRRICFRPTTPQAHRSCFRWICCALPSRAPPIWLSAIGNFIWAVALRKEQLISFSLSIFLPKGPDGPLRHPPTHPAACGSRLTLLCYTRPGRSVESLPPFPWPRQSRVAAATSGSPKLVFVSQNP
jgi:hypothetical protein